MIRSRCLASLCLALCCCAGPSAPGATEVLAPWAAEPAAQPLPSNLGKADAVVLYSETLIEFAPTGRRTERQRFVVRILTPGGRLEARAIAGYRHPADKMRQLSAWLQSPAGTVRAFGRKDIVDVARNLENLYSEERIAMIDASAEATAGSTFVWESIVEEPPEHAQDLWSFQSHLPTLGARCLLRLPASWSASAVTLNHEPVTASPTTDGLCWTVANVPALKEEPIAPPPERLRGRVCIDIHPPPAVPGRPPVLRTFSGWPDIAQFALTRFASSSTQSPALRLKAATLCAGKTTAWERTRTLAEFVQNIRYVAIAANLHRDGGFTPRPAETVLTSGYGDCKDKTSLLCAMLAEVGVSAFPVLAYSGDRCAVQPSWPSPRQFNHMFSAIRVDDSVESPLIVDCPGVGRLLLFDPTDPFTRIGGFPVSNQGALVLICAPGVGELIRVPFTPSADNRVTFTTTALLDTDGSLAADYRETRRGSAASLERAMRLERAKARKTLADELKEAIPGATSIQAETKDLPEGDACEITAHFSLPRYAQAIRTGLLTLRPAIAGRLPVPPLNEKERTLPLRLPPLEQAVVSEFTLPAEYHAVETGPDLHLETPFGSYEANVVCDGAKVMFRRKLIFLPTDIPTTDYEKLRAFLDAVRKRDKTPIIVERR